MIEGIRERIRCPCCDSLFDIEIIEIKYVNKKQIILNKLIADEKTKKEE